MASKKCHTNKCAKCKIRAWNEKHPLARAFHNLRSHARERGKDFSLTFEQFRSFALNTEYMKRKGRTTLSFQIDRKDNSQGYHAGNIQCITLYENCRKQFVPFFAHQTENQTYKPSAEEIRQAELNNT